jgi:DNA-binding beta-propeller fold protein YncE
MRLDVRRLCAVIAIGVVSTVGVTTGQSGASGDAAPPVPLPAPVPGYTRVLPWGPVPDNPSVFWEMGRVAVNTKGDLLYAFRRSDPPILRIDPATGKILNEFGAGMFVWPHGLHVDRDGNLWATDATVANSVPELAKKLKPALEAGYGHQVFKFSPEGKVLLVLGTKGVPGESPVHFNAPADVVVSSNGDIFVADGHVGTRIAKFSKDGTFLKTWGTKGAGPGQFSQPHSIAFDSQERLYVGDRGNARIQIFDKDGAYLGEHKQFGNPSGVAIAPDDTLYATDQGKKVVYVGHARTGEVYGIIPDVWAEGVSVDANKTVYAGEVFRRNLKKFVFAR